MFLISFLLFVVSFVLLVAGLIKPQLFKSIFSQPSRKRVGITLGFATFTLFVITIIATPDVAVTHTVEEIAQDQSSSAQVQQAAAPSQPQMPTLEDRIRSLAVKTGVTDISYRGIEDRNADSDRPAGSRMITVSLNLNDYYSASSLYRDTGKVTSRIFREAFTDPTTYDVIVWYYGDTTDQYGQKHNSIVLSQAIDKATFLKIAWDNFDESQLCDFLKTEGLRNGGNTTCVTRAKVD